LELGDGRLLTWSFDSTLRRWERGSGARLAVLRGHADAYWVNGGLELADGRLLSWADDCELRLWDGRSGTCLAVLEGHTDQVNGGLELADGRLLSRADDGALRVWDSRSGACLSVLEGHTPYVEGVVELGESRLLSWSMNETLQLWDSHSGECLEVVIEEQAARQHSDYLRAREKALNQGRIAGDFVAETSARTARLRHGIVRATLAAWDADSAAEARRLSPDGTVAVTQANGQVCFLKLQHGQRRVSLDEVEALLLSRSDEMRREWPDVLASRGDGGRRTRGAE